MKRLICLLTVILLASLLSGCAKREDRSLPVTGPEEKEDTYTLQDGTVLTVRKKSGPATEYLLDGAAILLDAGCLGLYDAVPAYVIPYREIPSPARERIDRCFREQGQLYDLDETLETAVEEYRRSPAEFQTLQAGQEVFSSASNQKLYWITTSVYIADRHIQQGAVFDIETGEPYENHELFTGIPEETIQALLEQSAPPDDTLREEMTAAWDWSCMTFFVSGMEMCFPQGTLPSQEYEYILGFSYEELEGLLQPWAVPEPYAPQTEKAG